MTMKPGIEGVWARDPVSGDQDEDRPSVDLRRGKWQPTPFWLFLKPPFRRAVYAFFGPRIRWEYKGEDFTP